MTRVLSRGWIYATVLSLLAIMVLSVIQVSAQETETITISHSPQVIEFPANPGDSSENFVRLTNASDVQVEVTSNPINFTAGDDEFGEPNLTEEDTSFSLADWITVTPEAYTLGPGEAYDFKVTVNVPIDAEPGGHFGGVEFISTPPAGNQTGQTVIGQQYRSVPLILVSVAGDIVESANIVSFEPSKSFWSNEDTISLETRIQNEGNVHFKPRGTVTIKNMFGKEVATIPLAESNVLPDSIRNITTEWNDPGFAVGKYTAEVSFVYGEDDTILSAQTSFIVFPYQTLLPIIFITIFALYVLVKFRKRIGMAIKVLSGKN